MNSKSPKSIPAAKPARVQKPQDMTDRVEVKADHSEDRSDTNESVQSLGKTRTTKDLKAAGDRASTSRGYSAESPSVRSI